MPPGKLVDSPNDIFDRPKEKFMSNDTNFPGSQVWHVVHVEESSREAGGLVFWGDELGVYTKRRDVANWIRSTPPFLVSEKGEEGQIHIL